MIENHNFAKKSRELMVKAKCGDDKSQNELLEHEIKAIQTYSTDFNRLFPAMSNVEFVYALVGAKKCVANMLNALLEPNPELKIFVSFIDATYDEVTTTKSAMIDMSTFAEMMKGALNDG